MLLLSVVHIQIAILCIEFCNYITVYGLRFLSTFDIYTETFFHTKVLVIINLFVPRDYISRIHCFTVKPVLKPLLWKKNRLIPWFSILSV